MLARAAADGNPCQVVDTSGYGAVACSAAAAPVGVGSMLMARPVITGALALAGVLSIAQGAWIPVKAALAQVLLDNAWRETLYSGQPLKPWPWADTWPVARLSVPAQG